MSKTDDRKIGVLAADGHTGMAVVKLLLASERFKGTCSVNALVYSEHSNKALESLGATVVDVSRKSHIREAVKGVDTLLVIPPARSDKHRRVRDVLQEAKKVKTVQNVVLLSSAGADYASKQQQPHLRTFVDDLEVLTMQPKSDPSSGSTGHSPCIVRAGFYAENLLAYSHAAQDSAQLTLPIDEDHKFAPVSLGDLALLLASIIVSKGPHGLADEFRGQLITLTGPMMVSGDELATAASQAFDSKMKFKSISDSEAQDILDDIPSDEMDDSEKLFLIEFYSLVKQGKTNYVAGSVVFEQATGQQLQSLTDFFLAYKDDFKPKKRRTSK